MNIAFLVPAPFDAVSGGYGYDRRITAGLRERGHAVRVVELAGRHPMPDAAAEASAREALAACAAEERIVLDSLGLPAFAPLVEELAKRGAIGLIHHPTCIETGHDDATRAELRRREEILYPRLSRLVATSPLTAESLPREFGVEAGRVAVVEPGTDPAPRAPGSGGETCQLLAVGVLVPRKGHDVLLRAVARLMDLDWHLTIAGPDADPACAAALRALAKELDLEERVTFAGPVTGAALEALYARSDVFALASHWEGYGMAVAEAMARGLPLAITKGGALAELMPPGAGVASPPGDFASLSKAMRRVIFDRSLRRKMADASWAAGRRLPRWEDRADAFAALLEGAA
ncbi:glycosyltransferase family 4 protein [Roseomonas gilardii]|uniref:Glycosyltransferase family 4 protein n=1 Tax=Roseomonas gilardii TaxID=257708 RepID=A0ABU3M9K6_9PROT|nr:glycosyltransferase family 4 protein [Roseomonas gilardii]MDT8329577.1 glycosyltransferase family 4 protein [Roseomonas gilardii]